jgi:prepilin signal peptidase PulO-like enzyme (type II secretory pathway)
MALAGGLAAALLLILRVRGKSDPIPYAPFIAGGALLVIFLQGTAFRSL